MCGRIWLGWSLDSGGRAGRRCNSTAPGGVRFSTAEPYPKILCCVAATEATIGGVALAWPGRCRTSVEFVATDMRRRFVRKVVDFG